MEQISFSPKLRDFYQNLPFTYVLDDHDIGKNNADATQQSTKIAFDTYNELAPGPEQ